jgi:NAD(P)H dehydrogenase (quinone)
VSRQSGQTVTYDDVPSETRLKILIDAEVPEPMAEILVGVDNAIERGRLAGTTGALARLIGRPTTPIGDSIAKALEG